MLPEVAGEIDAVHEGILFPETADRFKGSVPGAVVHKDKLTGIARMRAKFIQHHLDDFLDGRLRVITGYYY